MQGIVEIIKISKDSIFHPSYSLGQSAQRLVMICKSQKNAPGKRIGIKR